ncbi:RarD family permease [Rhodococcus rhodnii LMG 5362]|uniref:RarD family permease n=1 Tax=Rhodococcus rhodnii LMG 5362 TaxID=1273125 RepID=R7WS09_9NOCA|nr:RarD family permease [Rhodococcus rhodnii LMG 5362]
MLTGAGPVEILAHRVVWTLVLMLVVGAPTRRLGLLRGLPLRTWAIVAAASAAISLNWGVYIYAATSGRVVEAALGYFVNPLVSVIFGVVIFRERLTRPVAVALVLAFAAVVVITVDYGRVPVVALLLAGSFATYGLVKKVVPLDPRSSLTAEGIVAAPFAIGYLVFLAVTGTSTFVADGLGHTLLLLAAGPVTAAPPLLFGFAAKRVPLAAMGMFQYLTPTLQMAWGVLVAHEEMPASRWAGFALIWVALAIFTTDVTVRLRRRRGTPGGVGGRA